MKTYLFILIIGQSATTVSVDNARECVKLAEYTYQQAKASGIKDVQYGCFEEIGGRKKEI